MLPSMTIARARYTAENAFAMRLCHLHSTAENLNPLVGAETPIWNPPTHPGPYVQGTMTKAGVVADVRSS